jgi:hypothetical protein
MGNLKEKKMTDKELLQELDKFVGHKVKIKFKGKHKEVGVLTKDKDSYYLNNGWVEWLVSLEGVIWIKMID